MGSSKARVNGELQQQQPAGSSSRESAHCSSWSNCSESITEYRCSTPADNSRDSATPIQQQPSNDTQNGNAKTEEEKPKIVASRWKARQRRDKVGRQIDANAVPTSRNRIPQSQPWFESNHCDHGQQNGGPSTSIAAGGGPAEEGKAIVHIRVGRLRLLEHSPLLHPGYDGGQIFVEWNFLDMARDSCETEGTARLPRHHSEQIHFDQKRAYELNNKRVALLKQWTELNIRLTFTLAMKDPGENGEELNDLCTGGLDLAEVQNESQHTLIMRNVDNMAIAVLEVEVEYSEPLIQQIREDIDMAEEEDADESDMAEEEDLLIKLLNGGENILVDKPGTRISALISSQTFDWLGVCLCLFTQLIVHLVIQNDFIIIQPYQQLAFAWDSAQVQFLNGIQTAVISLMQALWPAAYIYFGLTRYVSERNAIIFCLGVLMCEYLLTYSWPFLPDFIPFASAYNPDNNDNNHQTAFGNASQQQPVSNCGAQSQPGCPSQYVWCATTTRPNMLVFIAATTLSPGMALPILRMNLDILYSKMLGNIKQGVWQALFVSGKLALEMAGVPIAMSWVFEKSGPRPIWQFIGSSLLLCTLLWLIFYRRMISHSERQANKLKNTKSSIVEFQNGNLM